MRVILQDVALRRSEGHYYHAFVQELPTIDAVPVVRCKDCKYLIAPGLCSNPMAVGFNALEPNEDDFCSRGEKKEEPSCNTQSK